MPKKLNAEEEWAEQTECLDHVVDFDLGLADLVGLAAVHSLPFYQVALFNAEKCLVHLNSLNSFQAEISVTGENFFQPTEKLGVDRCWSVSPSLPS